MASDDVLDDGLTFGDDPARLPLISLTNFCLLFVITFTCYGMWWCFKSWRYFKEKDVLQILPAMRALFSIFFLYQLFQRILRHAKELGYSRSYSSLALFILFLAITVLTNLSDILGLMAFVSLLCFIQPVKAMNYALENSVFLNVKLPTRFSKRQIWLMITSVLIWVIVLIGIFIDPACLE